MLYKLGVKGVMKFAEELRIKSHAYRRYRQRVGPIAYFELQKLCKAQLDSGDYEKHKGFIHLAGIWWAYVRREDGTLTFITCYGKSNMDLPAVLSWERKTKDRIDLKRW